MADEAQIIIEKFTGIDQSTDEAGLAKGASPDTQNMACDGGILSTAKGFAKYPLPQAPGAIRTLMKYYRRNANGSKDSFLLCATDIAVYVYNSTCGWNALCQNRQSGYYDFINYQWTGEDIIIFANGVDSVLMWTGYESAHVLAGGPMEFASLCLHYERVWGAGVKGWPDRVYYSKAFDPSDWSTHEEAGYIEIPTWNGGSVLALKTLYNDVAVFKDYDVYRIYGTYPGNYEVTRVHGITGPIARRSIVQAGDIVYFLGAGGLCGYDGTRAVPLGDRKLVRFFDDMNREYAKHACAAVCGDKVYLALPEGNAATCNNAVVEYDTRNGTYMIRRGFRVDTFLEYEGKVLFANDTGYIYEYGVGNTYDGVAIESWWKTPVFDMMAKNVTKASAMIYAAARGAGMAGGTGTIRIKADFDGKVKEKQFTLPQGMGNMRFPIRNRGRRMQFTFSNVEGSSFSIGTPEIHLELDED